MLRKVSFGLVLIAFIVCLGLWYEHYQFWQESVRESELNCRINKICFSAGGPHTYEVLAERYFRILLFLLFFLVGKLIKHQITSQTICVSSIALIIFQLWEIKVWYLELINTFSDFNTISVFDLLRNSIPFVWLLFFIISVLLIIQIIIIPKSLRRAELKITSPRD